LESNTISVEAAKVPTPVCELPPLVGTTLAASTTLITLFSEIHPKFIHLGVMKEG